MIVHRINSIRDPAVDFLIAGLSACLDVDDYPDSHNYHPEFKSAGPNLFRALANGRYESGCYFVLEKDGEYCGSGGWNHYKDNVALALTRAYIPRKYRSQFFLGKYLLPLIVDETKSYDHLWMTVNEHNKIVYRWLEQGKRGKWPEIYEKFVPLGETWVYNTMQYVLEYERD